MTTTIAAPQRSAFKPVKIEIEFTTRAQLAAFIQVMYNPIEVADCISRLFPHTIQAKLMQNDSHSLYYAIDSIIDVNTLEDLIRLANT